MIDLTMLEAWAEFAVRWLHVIAGIAWIGASFYFIALDLGLRREPRPPSGADGEEWQVHGGGFYHIEKYMVAPDRLPDQLTWFKWESYATWLSGFALLVLVYWLGAELYLIDPEVRALPVSAAVALSAGSLALGWLVYDGLCRSPLGRRPAALTAVLFLVILAAAWGYAQLFSGRAALLHLGALAATLMSGNVFFVIIPNQRVVVTDLRAGRRPDPGLGSAAKLRSTHNNYLTLPVVFLMLSNHLPLAFASHWNWLIAALTFPIGALIRHFFNSMHARKRRPWWTWAAAAALFALIVWLAALPPPDAGPAGEGAALPPAAARFVAAPGFDEAVGIVLGRCAMCHAAEPNWEGLAHPPGGVVLDSPEAIAREARAIYLQAGISRAMPPGNLGLITPAERAALVAWYRAGRAGGGLSPP
jgi:uncharacterized membrane protein